MSRKLELGKEYKDIITGYTGICIGVVEYLTGCNQALLKPSKIGRDGKMLDGEWLDEQRVVATRKSRVVLDNTGRNGPAEPAPKK